MHDPLPLKPMPEDDPAFHDCLERMVLNLIAHHAPEDIHLIRVKNWFDHKWMRFSGNGIVDFPGYFTFDVALDEFSQDQLTFPPFTPKRVVSQHCLRRSGEGTYRTITPERLVHPTRPSHSSKNLHRRVADFSQSAMFVWFSSRSAVNGRASVMTYAVSDGRLRVWYAGFHKSTAWRLTHVKGTSRAVVESLLERPTASEHAPTGPRYRTDTRSSGC